MSLLADLRRGVIAPVIYLCGERYAVDQLVQAIRSAVLEGGESAFNFDALVAPDAGAQAILSAARTVPMLGGRRLVQVRDAHLLAAGELAKLVPYVKDPSPSTCLLLIGEKADLRLKFFVELRKSGVVEKIEPLKERQAPSWLAAEANRLGVTLGPGAAERIVESVGTDMGQLASALEKLSLYAGPGKTVTTAEVEEVLAQTRQRSIFELTNAVGRGDREEALRVLRRMLQDREPGVRIVAMMARHLRQLWLARELSAAGVGSRAIADRIGVHPFFADDIIRQSRRFSEDTLQRTHRALFEADWRLKSSRLPDAIILDELVLRLTPAVSASQSS